MCQIIKSRINMFYLFEIIVYDVIKPKQYLINFKF